MAADPNLIGPVVTATGVAPNDRRNTRPLGHEALIVKRGDEPYIYQDDASTAYFAARENGFAVVSDLHVTPHISVRLFTTVDRPREVVVIKRFYKYLEWERTYRNPAPAEFLFSTLRTPATIRYLVLGDQLLPIAYTHAVAVKDFNPPPEDPYEEMEPGVKYEHTTTNNLDASIWLKYYNGMTLADLSHHFNKYQRKVPEMFIWHFIADFGRAIAYLHNGTYRSRSYNVATYGHTDINPETRTIRAPRASGWTPIAHFDSHGSNIFFHYPSKEEKALDPRLARYTDEFPQCILADFGQAFSVNDERECIHHLFYGDPLYPLGREAYPRGTIAKISCHLDQPDAPPEPETWNDKAHFGQAIKELLLASRLSPHFTPEAFQIPLRDMQASRDDRQLETKIRQRMISANPRQAALEMKIAIRGYSEDLIRVIERFEPIIHLVKARGQWVWPLQVGKQPWQARGFPDELWGCIEDARQCGFAPWEEDVYDWPLNDWCWGTLIALADVKMDQYQKGILNWDDNLAEDTPHHHPRNPSAAPLNMKMQAKKYIGSLFLEETMPAAFDPSQQVQVWHGGSKIFSPLEVMAANGRTFGPGITRTFPTGVVERKYITYDGLAPEIWPTGERKFSQWVRRPDDADYDSDRSGDIVNFEPAPGGPEADAPSDGMDSYWRPYDYTHPGGGGPGGGVLPAVPVPPTRPASPVPWLEDLINSQRREEIYGLLPGDDDDLESGDEGHNRFRYRPGGTGTRKVNWYRLTKDVFRGDKVMDVDRLASVRKQTENNRIECDLREFEDEAFAKEVLGAILDARYEADLAHPRGRFDRVRIGTCNAGDGEDGNSGGGGGGDNNDDDDNGGGDSALLCTDPGNILGASPVRVPSYHGHGGSGGSFILSSNPAYGLGPEFDPYSGGTALGNTTALGSSAGGLGTGEPSSVAPTSENPGSSSLSSGRKRPAEDTDDSREAHGNSGQGKASTPPVVHPRASPAVPGNTQQSPKRMRTNPPRRARPGRVPPQAGNPP